MQLEKIESTEGRKNVGFVSIERFIVQYSITVSYDLAGVAIGKRFKVLENSILVQKSVTSYI